MRKVVTPRQMIRNTDRSLAFTVTGRTPDYIRHRQKLLRAAAEAAKEPDVQPISGEEAMKLSNLKLERQMAVAVSSDTSKQFIAMAKQLKSKKFRYAICWEQPAPELTAEQIKAAKKEAKASGGGAGGGGGGGSGGTASTVSVETRDPVYDRELIELLDGGKPRKCRLVKLKGGAFTLYATAKIAKDEPIGIDCGVLREKADFERIVPTHDMRSLSSYGIEPHVLVCLWCVDVVSACCVVCDGTGVTGVVWCMNRVSWFIRDQN